MTIKTMAQEYTKVSGHDKEALDIIISSAKEGSLAVLMCTNKETQKEEPVICSVTQDPHTNEYSFIPLASILSDPMDKYTPPENVHDSKRILYA